MPNAGGFVKSVNEKYGVRPLVPFQTPIEIGDIGTVGSDGFWNPLSTLRTRFGVEPQGIRGEELAPGDWEDQSGRDIAFKVYANGEPSSLIKATADARLRTEIEFGSSRSFVFAASNVTMKAATELDGVIETIRFAFHNRRSLPESRRWERRHAFIFAVGSAKRFVALLADGRKTTLAVTASGRAGPPTCAAELTAAIRFGSSSSALQKVKLAPAPHCFYRAYRLRASILKHWEREPLETLQLARTDLLDTSFEGLPAGLAPAAMLGRNPRTRRLAAAPSRRTLHVSEQRLPTFEETFEAI